MIIRGSRLIPLLLLLGLLTLGCSSKREVQPVSLDANEAKLVAEIEFDPQLCELVKGYTQSKLQQLTAIDSEFNEIEADGLSTTVRSQNARQIVDQLETKLAPRGYHVFSGEVEGESGETTEVIVLKTDDPLEILRIHQTNGINHGITTDKLIETLRQWDQQCDLRIIGAGRDWVELVFSSMPDDVCRFAEQVYILCPDSVEQGIGLMNESEDPEMFAAARRLCPNMSAEMKEYLRKQHEQYQEMDIPPELKAMIERLSTSTEMGIRLLAYDLNRSNSIYLWWD